jgi:peroxiredoxin
MKVKTIFFCALILLVKNIASAQLKDEKNVVVFKGTTDTTYNGSTLVLYNKAMGAHDSVQVANGKFEIAVPYKGPGRYMFYSKYELKKKGGYAPYGVLVAASGTVLMKADMVNFTKTTVLNVPENDLYNTFIAEGMPAKQAINLKLTGKFGPEVMNSLKPANPQYNEVLKYYTELNEANNKIEGERLKVFIAQHPDAFASMYLLSNLSSNLPAVQSEQMYAALSKRYKETTLAKSILKSIGAMKITAIGKMAPEFQQTDTAGKIVKLSDFKGKYVLLDFWASWCLPCREENPNVVKAYKLFSEKGFTVLGISLDQPGKKQAWLDAIKQDGLSWTQVSDLKFWNNAVAVQYGVRAVPQNFLLDKEGKIIAANIKGDELTKKLNEIFSGK